MFAKLVFILLIVSIGGFLSYAAGGSETDKNPVKEESTSDEFSGNADKNTNQDIQESDLEIDLKKSPVWKLNDPDSSQYSVNKFNYLFYFIYRVKYANQKAVNRDTDISLTK